MSDRNPPITARKHDVNVTLVAVIGGFRSDMSITRMIDGNFWKRFRECFVFQSRISTKTVVISEIFRILPYLREHRSSISFHVFREFILFTSKLCVKYCFFADLIALFTSFRACLYLSQAVALFS